MDRLLTLSAYGRYFKLQVQKNRLSFHKTTEWQGLLKYLA